MGLPRVRGLELSVTHVPVRFLRFFGVVRTGFSGFRA